MSKPKNRVCANRKNSFSHLDSSVNFYCFSRWILQADWCLKHIALLLFRTGSFWAQFEVSDGKAFNHARKFPAVIALLKVSSSKASFPFRPRRSPSCPPVMLMFMFQGRQIKTGKSLSSYWFQLTAMVLGHVLKHVSVDTVNDQKICSHTIASVAVTNRPQLVPDYMETRL